MPAPYESPSTLIDVRMRSLKRRETSKLSRGETICHRRSRRIYVRARTDPQSAQLWWPTVANLAGSQRAYSLGQALWHRQTDGRIAVSLSAPLRRGHNKAVIERRLRPRCCHPESYSRHACFSTLYIRSLEIMYKHDVINIHCGLVATLTARSSPERPLPATGIPTCQAQGCV